MSVISSNPKQSHKVLNSQFVKQQNSEVLGNWAESSFHGTAGEWNLVHSAHCFLSIMSIFGSSPINKVEKHFQLLRMIASFA